MEQDLHSQKITILSRLVKESSLTLQECLLLLKEEEAIKPVNTIQPINFGGTTSPWTTTGPFFTSTGVLNRGVVTTIGTNPLNISGSLTTSALNNKLEDANL